MADLSDESEGVGRTVAASSKPSVTTSIIAGLVAGLLGVTFMFSFSAVILTGELAPFVPRLAGHLLLGGFVLALVAGLWSQYKGVVALPQNNPTAVLAVIVVSVLAGSGGSVPPEILFTTVIALIALSTVIGGAMLWLVGRFRLGQIGTYVPYPVVAGFLAATGWLLFKGSFYVMSGQAFDLAHLGDLTEVADLWIPGAVFAVTLWLLSKYVANPFAMPIAIVVAIAGFFGILGITGTSRAAAVAGGWLLEPFGGGVLIEGINPADIDWSIVVDEAGGMLTVLVIVAISVLLNLTALSSTLGKEVDIDRELRMIGATNLAVGAAGSLIGYHYVSLSTLGHRLKGDSRIVGVVVAVICLAAMTVGADALALIPKFVLGGMVMFIGIGFLDEWLFQSARKLSRSDLAIIVAILIVVEMVGFLEGVAVGLVIAVINFVLTYSRISVIRHELSGNEIRSSIERPPHHQQVLSEAGDSLLYLKLNGFLFFATTVGLLEEITKRLGDDRVLYIILDFEHVTGIDTSALHGIVKIKHSALEHGASIVACSLDSGLQEQLRSGEFADGSASIEPAFSDADDAVEWCENEILRLHGIEPKLDEHPLEAVLEHITGSQSEANTLQEHFTLLELDVGDYLVHRHEREPSLFFVESGELTVFAEEKDVALRIRRVATGALLGIATFFQRHGPDMSMSIKADTPARVYALSKESLADLAANDPDAAIALQAYALEVLSERHAANVAWFERILREEH